MQIAKDFLPDAHRYVLIHSANDEQPAHFSTGKPGNVSDDPAILLRVL